MAILNVYGSITNVDDGDDTTSVITTTIAGSRYFSTLNANNTVTFRADGFRGGVIASTTDHNNFNYIWRRAGIITSQGVGASFREETYTDNFAQNIPDDEIVITCEIDNI